jgi:hypothetical protein
MPFKEEDVVQINTIRSRFISDLANGDEKTNFSSISRDDVEKIWNCVEEFYISALFADEEIITRDEYVKIILTQRKIEDKIVNFIKNTWTTKWQNDNLYLHHQDDACFNITIKVIGRDEYKELLSKYSHLTQEQTDELTDSQQVDGGRKKKKTKKTVSKKRRARASRKRKTNKKKM